MHSTGSTSMRLSKWTTPEFEWFPVLGGTVERTSFKGREGIAEQFTELRDTWEEFRVVVEEIRDLGDRVLSLGTLEARGRSSGVEVESPIGWLADFRDGRIWRVRAFPDHDCSARGSRPG